MDPVSIASIVAGATKTGLTTTKALYDLHSKYKDAPMVIVSICSEAALVSASLTQIQSLILQRMDLGNAWGARTSLANALDTALTGCMVLFSCLDDEVRAIVGSAPDAKPSQIRWRARVRMIWNEQKLNDLLTALRGQQTAINLLIQLLQMNTLDEIKAMIQNSQGAIRASAHLAHSLRSQNPSVRVPASIYDGSDANFFSRQPLEEDQASVMAPSEIEFDFDDAIVSSQVYRRVLAQAKAQAEAHPRADEELGDLIDFSDVATARQHAIAGPSEDELLSQALQDLRGLSIEDPPSRKHTADTVTTAPLNSNAQAAEMDPALLVDEPQRIEASSPNKSSVPKPRETGPVDEPQPFPAARQQRRQEKCFRCHEPIKGQFLRAAARPETEPEIYHTSCYTCADCGDLVSSKFFPTEVGALCETDYFRRLDLLCSKCGKALRGSYITALDRKYHVEHFTCQWQDCSRVFGREDSYYEHGDGCYCLIHFSSQFASLCASCNFPILKQYVEIDEHSPNAGCWHPECYMIKKFWSVKISNLIWIPLKRTNSAWMLVSSPNQRLTHEEVSSLLDTFEKRIEKIWQVLSEFEEKLANLVTDVVDASSKCNWVKLLSQSKNLIEHLSFMFESLILVAPEGTGIEQASTICAQLISIFRGASATTLVAPRERSRKAFLTSAATMSRAMKTMVGVALRQSSYNMTTMYNQKNEDQLDASVNCIGQFRENDRSQAVINIQRRVNSLDLLDPWSDLCSTCSKRVEDKCYAIKRNEGDRSIQWHVECYACVMCRKAGAFDFTGDEGRFTKLPRSCDNCHRIPTNDGDIEFVPALRQHIYLMHIELARFMSGEKTQQRIDD